MRSGGSYAQPIESMPFFEGIPEYGNAENVGEDAAPALAGDIQVVSVRPAALHAAVITRLPFAAAPELTAIERTPTVICDAKCAGCLTIYPGFRARPGALA